MKKSKHQTFLLSTKKSFKALLLFFYNSHLRVCFLRNSVVNYFSGLQIINVQGFQKKKKTALFIIVLIFHDYL